MKPNREDSERNQARAENALFDAIVCLESTDEARDFFRDLCTPAELQALVDRWQVVAYLQQGVPYRQIHDLTGVSVTTIGRVARFLTNGFGGYENVLRRLNGDPGQDTSPGQHPANSPTNS
jgi:TrpR-related protein YerC/YecD